MLILDRVVTLDGSTLELPFYHKGHLSLKSGTEVTVCLIPHSQEADSPSMPEIVVSPVRFASWPHLWRITAAFCERAGVVHKLLSAIHGLHLNVLTKESSSIENRRVHQMEIIVDASLSERNAIPQVDRDELLLRVENRLTALCIDELDFKRGHPRLRVRRMHGLLNAWNTHRQLRDTPGLPQPDRTSILKGHLHIPLEISEYLKSHRPFRALVISDTKERILRLFCPPGDAYFTYVRVEHVDSRGALAAITGEIARAFDIVTSLTRIHVQGTKNVLELLLYSPEFPNSDQERYRRQVIHKILAAHRLAQFDLRISFPDTVWESNVTGERPRDDYTVSFVGPSGALPRIPADFWNLSTAEIANREVARLYEMSKAVPDILVQAQLRMRMRALQAILDREAGRRGQMQTVFVSYQFAQRGVFVEVEKQLAKRKCLVITGHDPDERVVFRDALIERIRSADSFLGIWAGDLEPERAWLQWELGVAQAYGLPFQLLVHQDLDPALYVRVNPEQNHTSYGGSPLEDRVARALSALLDRRADRWAP